MKVKLYQDYENPILCQDYENYVEAWVKVGCFGPVVQPEPVPTNLGKVYEDRRCPFRD